MAKKQSAKVSKDSTKPVEYLYPETKVHLCCTGGTHPPIDVKKAKDILGWKEEGEAGSNVKFGRDFLLTVGEGDRKRKVQCVNNVHNRPLYMSNARTLSQEILRGRWRMNGEPIIISKTGQVLNGQHQLVGLILASHELAGKPDAYPYWKEKPLAIEKVVVTGIDDDDALINTMDTCKPRTLADVIYRSPYFAKLKPQDRSKASRVTDYAIRFLWVRTAENLDGFAQTRTHAESVDFLERHIRLLKAVSFVIAEDSTDEDNARGRLADYLTPGYLAGMMYLMASSNTNTAQYLDAERLDETKIDFGQWDKAEEFIVRIAAGDCDPLRQARNHLVKEEADSRDARIALIVKAWKCHAAGKPITAEALKLNYITDDDGFTKLDDYPTLGGIDVGSIRQYTDEADAPATVDQEVEERKKAVKEAKKPKAAKEDESEKPISSKQPKKTKNPIVGKARWVRELGGNKPCRVKVLDVLAGHTKVRILQGFQGAGTECSVPTGDLLETQPQKA